MDTENRNKELCRRVVTTESFINEAKEIYGNTYDYSTVNYINSNHKVTITCRKHGAFQVYAREHLDGKGCTKCIKHEKFVEKVKSLYNDKFGLQELIYVDTQTPVKLICSKHGAFTCMPSAIGKKNFDCPKCKEEAMQALDAQRQAEYVKYLKESQEKREREKAELDEHLAKLEKLYRLEMAMEETDNVYPRNYQEYCAEEIIDEIEYMTQHLSVKELEKIVNFLNRKIVSRKKSKDIPKFSSFTAIHFGKRHFDITVVENNKVVRTKRFCIDTLQPITNKEIIYWGVDWRNTYNSKIEDIWFELKTCLENQVIVSFSDIIRFKDTIKELGHKFPKYQKNICINSFCADFKIDSLCYRYGIRNDTSNLAEIYAYVYMAAAKGTVPIDDAQLPEQYLGWYDDYFIDDFLAKFYDKPTSFEHNPLYKKNIYITGSNEAYKKYTMAIEKLGAILCDKVSDKLDYIIFTGWNNKVLQDFHDFTKLINEGKHIIRLNYNDLCRIIDGKAWDYYKHGVLQEIKSGRSVTGQMYGNCSISVNT